MYDDNNENLGELQCPADIELPSLSAINPFCQGNIEGKYPSLTFQSHCLLLQGSLWSHLPRSQGTLELKMGIRVRKEVGKEGEQAGIASAFRQADLCHHGKVNNHSPE